VYNTFENGVIIVPLKYKIDVIFALKERGYTTYKLRQEKLLSEGALQSIRTKAPISWANIERLCELLDCQPGDIMEYVPEE
jgi:putative transcriptional regulator